MYLLTGKLIPKFEKFYAYSEVIIKKFTLLTAFPGLGILIIIKL
jgi:hypothetical protein